MDGDRQQNIPRQENTEFPYRVGVRDMSDVTLHLGDCLDILPALPDKSVDAIITDLPYGTTACKWDVIIPLAPMWEQVRRLLKKRGAFVTTSSQPFTSVLVCSNLKQFKYEWAWNKKAPTGFLDVHHRPMKVHENVLVFSKNGHTYNPQITGKAIKRFGKLADPSSEIYHGKAGIDRQDGIGYPKTIVEFLRPINLTGGGLHPTQKPVSLYEYLVRTYTNEGDTVLDFCAGSGTTGVAAIKTGRNAILIEKERKYFEIMQRRISETQTIMEAA